MTSGEAPVSDGPSRGNVKQIRPNIISFHTVFKD